MDGGQEHHSSRGKRVTKNGAPPRNRDRRLLPEAFNAINPSSTAPISNQKGMPAGMTFWDSPPFRVELAVSRVGGQPSGFTGEARDQSCAGRSSSALFFSLPRPRREKMHAAKIRFFVNHWRSILCARWPRKMRLTRYPRFSSWSFQRGWR